MPYGSIESLPMHVKKYPAKIKRMWMHVFNSVFKKTNSEERAFKAANSVLKKNIEKNSASKYGYDAYFNHLVDSFLKNI